MKSDRLIVLLAPEEKARIVALARAQRTSVGELVRSALASLDRAPSLQVGRTPNGADEPAPPTAEQTAALERLADIALHRMQNANLALDQAFAEIEATKAHFAARRRGARSA